MDGVLALVAVMWLLAMGGGEPAIRVFQLPQRVAVGVPADWTVAHEETARAYESARRSALEREGLALATTGVVPFQAARESGAATGSVMLTFLPPEASQEEVDAWSPAAVEKLGRSLGEATRVGLTAARSRDFWIGEVERIGAGEKTALRLSVEFTGPDGRRYQAAKYFIYTSSRTVILTLQWTKEPPGITQRDRDRILRSFRVE